MSNNEKNGKEPFMAPKDTGFLTVEKIKEDAELGMAKKELLLQNDERLKRAAELIIANKELIYQNIEKEKRADELIIANRELIYQNQEKENRAAELIIANKELAFQNEEKEKRAAALHILNEQLKAKERQLSSHISAIAVSNASIEFDLEGTIISVNENLLTITGYDAKDLLGKNHSIFIDKEYAASKAYQLFWSSLKKGIHQKDEFKRVAKNGDTIWLLGSYNPILDISGKPYKILKLATDVTLAKTQFLQLAAEALEKEKRACELAIANKELAFQNNEKENRAAELLAANQELLFQNKLKEKLASELSEANRQLAFQNSEKEKRVAELIIANKELEFQNEQKEKRAVELVSAHKELAIQGKEKEKRAAQLITANKKLAMQSIQKEKTKAEKEKRAAELIVTNRELAYQEKRGSELMLANDELKKAQEELGAFSYSVSHDLRAPIRAINGYAQILIEDHSHSIDADGKQVLQAVINNSKKMGLLIDDLLAFSKLGRKEVTAAFIDMSALLKGVVDDIISDNGKIAPLFEMEELLPANGDQSLIRQVWVNLISNAVKYSKYKPEIRIKITSKAKKGRIEYCVKDWGSGFDMEYYDKLFGVFQRLHSQEEFEGTGIGLAIVQKIVSRHHGAVWAKSKLGEGSNFYFSLPDSNNNP
ncbi:ATP-binding protein [uncultured Flavobacterium sp.]|uniref:PAS domain-containing sensor histidine kinase n=1 Tax=uncultured Flavobacterium sp. TaxID=165435 RepID=UPI0025E23BF2|nr:ATP-binding protein [uncultured Flavobacterium sp.]